MPKRLEWDAAAVQELEDSIAWYAERNGQVARRMVVEVRRAAQSLIAPELPATGRPGVVTGTRELVVGHQTPFILVFIDEESRRKIIRCRHERRDYP
jgi:plasmid stabilization system protein ParE